MIDKAREKGNYTEGVYVSSRRQRGDRDFGAEDRGKASVYRNDTLWVKYEYQVKGKKYYKTYGFQSPGCASIDYPYRITIFYDARNPKKAYSDVEEPEKQRKMRGWYLTIFFVILIYGMVRNL